MAAIALLDQRREEPRDEGGGPVESTIQVYRGNDGFEGTWLKAMVSSGRPRPLPPAEEEEFSDPEAPGQFREGLLVHDGRPEFRELSFGIVGEFLHQHVADGSSRRRRRETPTFHCLDRRGRHSR